MRTPVEGTVARDRYEDDPEVATGLLADKSGYVMTVPTQVVMRQGSLKNLLDRGQERFGIYCAPCHGRTGDGKGMIVCKRDKATDPCESRGFPPLPSYEDPRLRQMPDGQLFATITHGVRTMPAYGPQIPVGDRWAIVSYVRALEVSQLPPAASPSQPEPKK
jgi:mono/diheme cytochrome c family protein